MNQIHPRATKCLCGATYRANNLGCLPQIGQIALMFGLVFASGAIGVDIANGSPVSPLGVISVPLSYVTTLIFGVHEAFAGFVVFVIAIFVSFKYILGTYTRMFTRYSWHRQDEPNVIVRN
jgi:hypothetical protein